MNPAEFANIDRAEQILWWYRGMTDMFLRLTDKLLPIRDKLQVVETGSGTGYFASVLQRHYPWQVTATDLSLDGLRYSRRHGLRALTAADMRVLPFRRDSFDALFSMDVLVHLEAGREGEALREFARVLRPGGYIALRVSALDILRSRHSQHAHERQRFTKDRLTAVVRSAGFHVLRCTYANSLLLPVALAKFRVWEPLTRKPPTSGVQLVSPALNKLLELPLQAETALLSAGVNLPAGQSLLLFGRKTQGGAEPGSSRGDTRG